MNIINDELHIYKTCRNVYLDGRIFHVYDNLNKHFDIRISVHIKNLK